MRHLALSLLFLLGCAPEGDEDVTLDNTEQELSAPNLSNGTRVTIAGSIDGAENLLITSDKRLFISGDKGVYELKDNGKDAFTTVVLATSTETGCSFGGLAEARGTLYVNCYGSGNKLLAAKLDPKPVFVSAGALSGSGNANGLTSDDQGRLYVAFTFGDKIARITTGNSPLVIATQEAFVQGSGGLTNGLAQYAGTLYWTDAAIIKRRQINGVTTTNIVTQFSYFDDLRVDANGVLAADFTGGVIRAYDSNGKSLGSTPAFTFNGPTSVIRANGRLNNLDASTLIVTERLGKRVSIWKP